HTPNSRSTSSQSTNSPRELGPRALRPNLPRSTARQYHPLPEMQESACNGPIGLLEHVDQPVEIFFRRHTSIVDGRARHEDMAEDTTSARECQEPRRLFKKCARGKLPRHFLTSFGDVFLG